MVPQQVSFVERSSLSQRVPYRRFHCIPNTALHVCRPVGLVRYTRISLLVITYVLSQCQKHFEKFALKLQKKHSVYVYSSRSRLCLAAVRILIFLQLYALKAASVDLQQSLDNMVIIMSTVLFVFCRNALFVVLAVAYQPNFQRLISGHRKGGAYWKVAQ